MTTHFGNQIPKYEDQGKMVFLQRLSGLLRWLSTSDSSLSSQENPCERLHQNLPEHGLQIRQRPGNSSKTQRF